MDNKRDAFTIGELADSVTSGNERAMRKLLNCAGAEPLLDEYRVDPSETVPWQLVVNLAALRAGKRVGEKLAELLTKPA